MTRETRLIEARLLEFVGPEERAQSAICSGGRYDGLIEQIGGPPFRLMETSFFLGRQTLIAAQRPAMALWREGLFSWMLRNAESAMEFFKLPPNRVVELGSQVEI